MAAAISVTPSGDGPMLSKYDEETLLQKLVDYRQLTKQTNKEINRLQRKLTLRRLQRKSGRRCFDLADTARSLGVVLEGGAAGDRKDGDPECNRQSAGGPCALDRYKTADDCACTPSAPVGVVESEEEVKAILSPFTGRLLKPYIRRDLETKPPKLQLFEEICKSNGRPSSKRSSIDFCYIRPQLIAPINHLARHFFWPGIDVSESLQYPDFTVVAMYRKVIVGFAFLVPHENQLEAYISFLFTHPEWRRAGIAKFMLYHLVQSCLGKDITLHVSANNHAAMLYQIFGFKVEERILNFYDKYLPANSTECKHALFMRLTR